MDSLEAQLPPDILPGLPRARRIRDEEWEVWRDVLIRLYVEDDVSRKDLVDTMAKDHQFIVNEKQLKHRFKKWNVKKYIPDSDMAAMLSFQRKHRAAGDRVAFGCRGQIVEEARLELAAKRRKRSLPPEIELPSYVTASISCRQPEVNLGMAPSEITDLDLGPFTTSQPNVTLGGPWKNSQVLNTSAEPGHNSELTEGIEEFERIDGSPTAEASDDVIMAHGFELDLRGVSLDREPNDSSATFFDEQIDHTAAPRHVCSLVDQSLPLPESPYLPDIDWSSFLGWPPSRAPSIDQGGQGIEPIQNIVSTYQSLSNTSPVVPIERILDYAKIVRDDLLPAAVFSAHPRRSRTLRIPGNIDIIMLPLQLLNSHFNAYLEQSSIEKSSFGEHAPQDFLAVSQSDWLCREMENLLCWAYDNAARSVRQRQQARNDIETNSSQEKRLRSDDDCERSILEEDWHGARTMTRAMIPNGLKSNLFIVTQTGTLKIHLRTPKARQISLQVPQTLRLSFMPAASVRTVGITASFNRYSNGMSVPQISRNIKTFNVVPQDSAIIQCILRNDLIGVQGLFDRGEASPLDVDPYGFSLLSYAINSGGPDIFLLLLRGGANTQNCDHYGSALDIVWSIWFRFFDHMSHAKSSSATTTPLIGDLGQCIRLTNAVLDGDHDMEEAVCYNSDRANVLFEMDDTLTLGKSGSRTASEVLNFLINKGYDIEKRNYEGLTPLLHAVRSFRPQSLGCLKTFIMRGANIHACNTMGQGALHIALAGPCMLLDWTRMRHGQHAGDTISDHYWTLQVVYHTDTLAGDHDEGNLFAGRTTKAQTQNSVKYPVEPAKASEWTVVDETFDEVLYSAFAFEDELIDQAMFRDDPRDSGFTDEMPEYVLCKDYDGIERLILHPIEVLKTRLQSLLLELLEAGCDPNIVDGDNVTPSTYARRNGLWPQWHRALGRVGYTYEVRRDRWVKSMVPARFATVGPLCPPPTTIWS